MKSLRSALLLALSALLAACAAQKFSADQAPEYIIVKDYTPFYRIGPAQPGGPDATLHVNDRVKVLSRELGYSQVKLETDDRIGYIDNDAMAVAPPRPSPTPYVDPDAPVGGKKGKRGAAYHGQQPNDTPLPDVKVPPPDLNIAPEEVPASPTSTPTPPPEKPKFRT